MDKAVVDTFNQVDAFGKLTRAATRVTEAGSHVPAADVVAMHAALLAFTAAVYPDRLDLVNKVLTSAYQVQSSSVNPGLYGVLQQMICCLAMACSVLNSTT